MAPERGRHCLPRYEYYSNTQHIADMGIIIYPVSSETILQSHPFRAGYGLMVNDSIIAACMQENGIKYLATKGCGIDKTDAYGSCASH